MNNATLYQVIITTTPTLLLGLIALIFRRIGKRVGGFFDEHHWLMVQTKKNTDDIKRILLHIERTENSAS